MSIITPELCFHMEQLLLEDELVDQAKIVDLANLDSTEPDLVVAVSLSDPEAQDTPKLATAAIKAIQKELVRNMSPYGGKQMIPRRWARPQSLPLRSGAIDALALRRQLLLSAHQEEEGIFAAPSSVPSAAPTAAAAESVEDKVVRIVAEALGMESKQVDMAKSFFENGGDSFTAISITGRLMMEGISLRVPDIVGARTMADLRSRVLSRHDGEAPAAAAPAAAVSTTTPSMAAPARRESIVLQTMPRRDSIGFQPSVRGDSWSLRRGSLAAQSIRRPSVVQ
ncbi:hypothetical protein N3K66_007635 [Trichothecium roseum]|uniref:Uncharacterized protein n=1 Tax=Trichothecium roseum TaxID=47278 RepID=A0ACC0UWA0_9HYPO|nr:hypothetical protein N3K66_007635 [Trichothecium roseum]